MLFYNKESLAGARIISFEVQENYDDILYLNNSNKITPLQREVINRVPIFGKFAIEFIKVKLKNKIITLDTTIIIKVDGPKACLLNILYYPNYLLDSIYPGSLYLRYIHSEEILTKRDHISKKSFLLNNYLLFSNPNHSSPYDIDQSTQILCYNCCIYNDNHECVDTIIVAGNLITKEIKKKVKSSGRISGIYFKDIIAKTTVGEMIKVGDLYLKFE